MFFRFLSCKFFKLISRDKKSGKIMKKCNYVGPMTVKQMKALVSALKDYEVHETATIGNINLNQKFKLREVVRHIRYNESHSSYIENVWENLNYGNLQEDHGQPLIF